MNNNKVRENLVKKCINKNDLINEANITIDYFLNGLDKLLEYYNKLKTALESDNATLFNDLLNEINNFINQYKLNNKFIFNTIYYWNFELDGSETHYSNIKFEYNILNDNMSFNKINFRKPHSIEDFLKEILDKKNKCNSIHSRLYYRKCALQNIKIISEAYNL